MRRIAAFTTALALLGILASGCSAPPEATTDSSLTAFVHVNVVPMDEERVLEDQTVLVQGDRILEIGPAAEVIVPGTANRVDGAGRYLMPGLADMHTHPGSETTLELLVLKGVTTTRIMIGIPQTLIWREQTANGELLGPDLIVASPIFDTFNAPPSRISARTAEAAVAAVDRFHQEGYDFIKVHHTLSADVYHAIVARATELGLPVAGHVSFSVGLRGVLAAGQRSIEHAHGYVQELVPDDAPDQPARDYRSRKIAWLHADPARMPGLAGATADAGVWNTLTLTIELYMLPAAEMSAYLASAEADYLPPDPIIWRLPDLARPQLRVLRNFSDEDFEQIPGAYRQQHAFMRALRYAGAGLLAGTDRPPWGFTLHRELSTMVRGGLTPFEALATATRNPAEYLERLDEVGTITSGKRADLVLVEGNPLDDIDNTSRIAGVMVRGRWLPGEELQERLEAIRVRYQLETEFIRAQRSAFMLSPAPAESAGGRLVRVLCLANGPSPPVVVGVEEFTLPGERGDFVAFNGTCIAGDSHAVIFDPGR